MADPVEERIARVERDPRRQWGWGPSALASNEEKDAWRVAAGEAPRDIRNDPAYRQWAYTEGGYAKSRRTMRMQEEWQKQQMDVLQQQRLAQQMEQDRKQMEIANAQEIRAAAKYQSDLDEARARAKMESERDIQRARFDSGFAELDPRTPDFLDQVAALRKESPLALLVPEVKGLVDDYAAINAIHLAEEKEKQKDIELDKVFRVQQEATAAKYGVDTEQFVKGGEVDRVGLMRSIGEAQRNEIEEAEKKAAKAKLDAETQAASKELSKEARNLQDEIELTEITAERSKGKVREEALIKLDALVKQRDRRVSQLQDLGLPRLTKGDKDKKAYEELPEGAELFLDGVKVRKPKKQTTTQQPTPVATPQPTQLEMAPVTPPPPAAGPVAQPTPQQILQTSNDPLELAKASTQAAEQTSKAEQEKERQAYIARVERAFAESPTPNPDVFQTPKAKEIASSPNARELAQERYRELQGAAFTGGLRTALPKKKKEIPDDVFEKVLAEMFELRVLLGESTSDAQDLIDRIRSNK